MKQSVLWKMIKKKHTKTRNARIIKEKRCDIYTEEIYINIINAIYDKPTANITSNLKALSSETQEGCQVSSILFNIVLEILATAIRQEKEIKDIWIGKKEIKQKLCVNDMILYRENSKDSSKELFELIKEFSKAAEYKINICKSSVFLYTNTKLTEREFKKTVSFEISSKRIKYLGIN